MRPILIVVFISLVLSHPAFAQLDKIQNEIDEQVWKPFIRSINNSDTGSIALYSKDVTYIKHDKSLIVGYNSLCEEARESARLKNDNRDDSLKFSFTQRIITEDKTYEILIYKKTSTDKTSKSTKTSYGELRALLRKENGTWKIFTLTESHKNITAENFKQGSHME